MTLFELNHIVRNVLESNLDNEYWVEGELSDARVGSGGHFYGELIQKDAYGATIARAKTNCWARTYNILRLRFKQETGASLQSSMQVKMLVQVTFHEQYGYALNIIDIDSSYTLGDIARRRKEILNQLERDGILHDNQTLTFPYTCKRIAIVSAKSAAGYGDFCNQILNNEYGLFFHIKLFDAVMQGQHVEESVAAALEEIATEADLWDVVVIIRGGGASGDLIDFDSYTLASCIAQFPLPVIVGIGHERDETVLDYVAHTHVKTPTAAAAFIINHQANLAAKLESLSNRMTHCAQARILNAKTVITQYQRLIPTLFTSIRQKQEQELRHIQHRIKLGALNMLTHEQQLLENARQRVQMHDPQLIIKRGFTMTTCNGHVITHPSQLQQGDEITTHLANGQITSIVNKIITEK